MRMTPDRNRKKRGLTRRRFLFGGFAVAGLSAPATLSYAASEASSRLALTHYAPKPSAWPAGRRLSITVIADLHVGGPNLGRERVREVVELANAQQSDLIVLLGDYVATHAFVTERVPYDVWAGELGALKAPLGTWAVLGNHDWRVGASAVRRALSGAGIPVLENDVVRLGEGASRFWLAGLGDQLAYKIGHSRYVGVDDLPGTLRQVTGAEPLILLAHEPDIFTRVPDRVALTIAGHTHGGQVRLPLIWPVFVPSAYGARFAYGHIVEQSRHMIVSGGIGTSIVPARLGIPPEIVRIQLGG
jgi:predicted MPP superfamily phosphohydrolase